MRLPLRIGILGTGFISTEFALAVQGMIDGRKVVFKVEAWDDIEKIGEGTHTRFVVDLERFNQRFEEKRARKAGGG